MDTVFISVAHADRPGIAAWLLDVADSIGDVVSVSDGFVIPLALWDRPHAGRTVGDYLSGRAAGVSWTACPQPPQPAPPGPEPAPETIPDPEPAPGPAPAPEADKAPEAAASKRKRASK